MAGGACGLHRAVVHALDRKTGGTGMAQGTLVAGHACRCRRGDMTGAGGLRLYPGVGSAMAGSTCPYRHARMGITCHRSPCIKTAMAGIALGHRRHVVARLDVDVGITTAVATVAGARCDTGM